MRRACQPRAREICGQRSRHERSVGVRDGWPEIVSLAEFSRQVKSSPIKSSDFLFRLFLFGVD